MNIAVALGSIVKAGLGIFTTVSREKRAMRMELFREAVKASGMKNRTLAGWALVFLAFVALIYDVVVNGGDNFETLMQLLIVSFTA